MSHTLAPVSLGGTEEAGVAIGSLLFTTAANNFTALTAVAGDDARFLKLAWNAGAPTISWAAPSVSDISQNLTISGDLSPPQITTTQNNYNPASLSTATVLRLSTDADASIKVTGLAGGADGRVIIAFNVGSNNLVFANQDAASTAANRFLNTVDVTVKADESESFWYDSTTSRWRGLAMHFGVLAIARGGTNSSTALSNNRMIISASGALAESAILRTPAGASGEIRFYETPANGTSSVGLKAAASLTADTTWTLPSADGTSGQVLSTNGSGVMSWTTVSGTSVFTASAGIIDYGTSTDRLRLKIGEVGDIGLEINGRASLTANYVDIKALVADTQPIVAVDSTGKMRFGPGGTTAVDTSLYRSAANTLTMDHVVLAGTATSGGAVMLTLSPASHTAVTAESSNLKINANTITITAGYTNQRFTLFNQPTITAASALTITTAATVAILGAPAAAGSAVITNSYALWIQGGRTQLDGDLGIADAKNIIFSTTTGSKIGTATTQKLGFYNATPIVQPSAYTQTYSTADKTHANFTSADLSAFTGGTVGFLDAAERDGVRTQFNALRADVADIKQLVNSIIDDLQLMGLVG